MSNFGETLDLDQIEGAEFEFLGPEARFERNSRNEILKIEIKVPSPKSNVRQSKKHPPQSCVHKRPSVAQGPAAIS